MSTIFKRELKEYFITPIAYIYLFAMTLVSAIYFIIMLMNGTASFESEFLLVFTITLLFVPLITMRLMCDEKKQCTMQLLMSSPIKIIDIVIGKFFAASVVYSLGLIPLLFYALSIDLSVKLNWAIILANLFGLALVGMACIAICMVFSAITDSQIVSAIAGFAAMIAILLVNTFAGSVKSTFIRSILYRFSFYNSYYGMTVGVFRISDIWFFITVVALFLFLTSQVLYRQRIRGK